MKQMDRWFRNLKYRYKITLLVLAAGILPVVIMAVYFLRGDDRDHTQPGNG